jgi:hypothetical protein
MIKKTKLFKALRTYKILIIILAVILFYVGLRYVLAPDASPEKLMNDFMAGFFLVFGALQINTLNSTKEAIRKYDPIAKKFPWYAEVYPFVFLFFGVALHTNSIPIIVSVFTILMLGIQTYGIIKTLKKGTRVLCACAGTKFSIPLSYVAVTQNGIMITMAVLIILLNLI